MRPRRLRVLAASDLATLPLACRCRVGHDLLADPHLWADAAVERFGCCGVAAMDAGEPIGWLLLSPALNLPTTHPVADGPRNPDAAVLVQVQVAEPWQGIGIGRQLVQSAAGRLADTARSIEALGVGDAATCAEPPLGWLSSTGFQPVENGVSLARSQRMRLDLDRTVRWSPDYRDLWGRLTAWARPSPAVLPAPSARATPRSAGDRTPGVRVPAS